MRAVITLIATPTADGLVDHMARVTNDQYDPFQADNSATAAALLSLPSGGRLNIVRCAQRIFVNWIGSPGLELQSTAIPGSGSWSYVGSGIFDNGILKTLIVTNPAPAAFYRLGP